MKRTIAAILLASPVFAFTVHDPITSANVVTMNSKQLAQWATAIKKYEDQIMNQIKQLEEAKKLLDLTNTVAARVGDWKGVVDRARAIQTRAENLTKDYGVNWRHAAYVDYGEPTIHYTAGGTYVRLKTTTVAGNEVQINEPDLRRFRAVENFYDDVNVTFDQTETERKKILKEIADTAEEIATAKTQAETDKAFAKLEALKAALANVQAQRDEKMQRLLVQQALNANQEAKETKIKSAVDNQNATEALKALGTAKTGGNSFR